MSNGPGCQSTARGPVNGTARWVEDPRPVGPFGQACQDGGLHPAARQARPTAKDGHFLKKSILPPTTAIKRSYKAYFVSFSFLQSL